MGSQFQVPSKGKLLAAAWLGSVVLLTGCGTQQHHSIVRHVQNPWEPDIGYSAAAESNGMVFISGVTCGGATYAEAVPKCYEALSGVLAKLQMSPQQIIKENVYTKDIEAFKEQGQGRKAFYGGKEYPAATWIQVNRFFSPEELVEIELVAVRSEKR